MPLALGSAWDSKTMHVQFLLFEKHSTGMLVRHSADRRATRHVQFSLQFVNDETANHQCMLHWRSRAVQCWSTDTEHQMFHAFDALQLPKITKNCLFWEPKM